MRALAEPIDGPLVTAVRAKARELGIVVVMNFFERDGERTFDSSPVIDADGTLLGVTRMIHITEYPCFHEQGYYTPGDTGAPVYRTQAGSIGVAICYDRHYPEYMRALALDGADLVIVPQAGTAGEWPDGLYEGEMRVAALQNGYSVALCNRVGPRGSARVRRRVVRVRSERQCHRPRGPGTDEVLLAEVDPDAPARSHARQLFLKHRRPELYAEWLGPRAEPRVPKCQGASVPRCSGARVLAGTQSRMHSGTTGTLAPWHFGTLALWHPGTFSSLHSVDTRDSTKRSNSQSCVSRSSKARACSRAT